jgi:hypothetical protein
MELLNSEQAEHDRQQAALKHPAYHDQRKCGKPLLRRRIRKQKGTGYIYLERLLCPIHHLLVDSNGWEIHWSFGIYTPPKKK